jgi:uncharacterized protein
MKVFITGGTGFVGGYFTRRLIQLGHEVTVLTRFVKKREDIPREVRWVEGDPRKPGRWQEGVPGHDVVINLAGKSIFTPWTKKARKSILESRVLTTRNLVESLGTPAAPRVLLSASAVGYYGSREDDEILDETTTAGDDFLAEVGVAWETEARQAERFGARVVLCRFGIIMGRNGGALEKMVPAFKFMMGAPLGSGRQWFPWIHQEDLFGAMLFAAEKEAVEGPVNCTSPNSVRNEELTRTLAEVVHRPLFMPRVPGFVLRTILGEFGDILLKGQRAVPAKLQSHGFRFKFPTLRGALEDLI